jgi:hypothetical protein
MNRKLRFNSQQGQSFFSSPQHSDWLSAYPAFYLGGMGGSSFPRGTGASSRTDHSLPFSIKVMNVWSYTSTLPHALMTQCLIKHKDNFTLPSENYCREKMWDETDEKEQWKD